jgi:cysteine-rich repeat protein
MSRNFLGLMTVTIASLTVACGDDGRGDTATPDTTTTTGVTTLDGTTTTATTGPEQTTGTTADPTTGTTAVDPTTGSTTDITTTTSADPVCGDGVMDDGEECDAGADNGDDKACTAACKTAVCGDGLLLAGVEECDAGPGNGETEECTPVCKTAVCGDGYELAGVEGCDDGNTMDGDGCSATCISEDCGDGVVQAPEECDDANDVLTDACLPNCKNAACGDGVVFQGTEVCDDGNADESDTCTTKCAAPSCSDMLKSGMEADVDCGGPCMQKCAIDQACLVNADCDTNVCKMNVCGPGPRTCKEVLANDPAAKSGLHKLDLDSNPMTPPLDAWCDMTTNGGGWTIFYAATGADNQPPITSDIQDIANNPLSFQFYNFSRTRKMQLAALATETLFYRNNNTWLKASAPAFNDKLAMANQTYKVGVMLTANNGVMSNGFMGYANYANQGGGDFGVTLGPDGLTCGQYMMNTGFDHHGISYRMLNCSCERHYLYSYSSASNDGDAGYDSLIALGGWTASQANCGAAAAEGGALVFYAAMR